VHGLGGGKFVIAKDLHVHAQLAEVLDQVEGEGIVVVDDEQHF
jgi:mannose-6-phosphate isomerase-like protein (cupin superfamily)